ncbi:unnamed protein product [Rotaria magnacalcarata]|uniref:SH3 domain-containing protein n=1 Tax=Rotaria magnacalcarata TaxID=392030 RepID=A0A816UL70_9BILA|nr:unnamed protein product [Rotaria magnacalcarata]CAF4384901.1 unnamed protein product [Rotaria magnacalcarata]
MKLIAVLVLIALVLITVIIIVLIKKKHEEKNAKRPDIVQQSISLPIPDTIPLSIYEGQKVISLANFVPDLPDELEVNEGDELTVVRVFADNWAAVDLTRDGKTYSGRVPVHVWTGVP